MLFNSFEFLIFFLVVLGVSCALEDKREGRILFLFLASCYFYMCWDWRFLFLILGSTFLDYIAGWRIYISESRRTRRLWLIVSLSGNLGCLGFFKYYNFFAEQVAVFFAELGLNLPLPHWEIILPVGISFYTFQSLSYTVDIYRGQLKPTRNLLHFATFVSFFPQLVAGPIVRAKDFLPQLKEEWRFSDNEAMAGMVLVLQGLFKKVCIADALATSLIDNAYNSPENFSGFSLLLATYGYAMQIYCDFSGYSDIAIGTARILGFKLPLNFNRPYMAISITDFWRRWHISLSTWLRDYLYIPLGGNQKGKLRTYRNLLITMLLGGLWHGAAWSFVFWGGLHGAYLAVERAFGWGKVSDRHSLSFAEFWGRRVFTFHLVCFGWVFFRADGIEAAWIVLRRIFTMADGNNGLSTYFLLPLVIGYLMHFSPQWLKTTAMKRFQESHVIVQSGIIAASIFCFMLIVGDNAPFIYFQF